MSENRYTYEFKIEAVRQIEECTTRVSPRGERIRNSPSRKDSLAA